MPSFIEKLRLDNLYPSIETPSGMPRNNRYPLFEKFMQEIAPLEYSPRWHPEMEREQEVNPAMAKPMNVVFKPNIGEQAREMSIARDLHGVDFSRNSLSPYQAGQLSLRDRQLQQQDSVNKQRLANDSRRIGISEFKSKNPGIKIVAQKGGNIRAINSATGAVVQDFGPTGEMDEAERIGLEQSGKMEIADKQGENAIELENKRETNRESLEDIQARHARELASHKGEIKNNTPILPSQERVAKLTRAEEARNSHPEWSKYIKIVPGGGFAVTAPGKIFGPTREVYDAINRFIESSPEPIRTVPTTPAKAPAITQGRSKYQVQVK